MFFDTTMLPQRLAFVEREFPFPLAVTYGRIWQEVASDQPIPVTLQMKDAVEVFLKFVASAAVADCLNACPPREVAGKVVATLFKPLANGAVLFNLGSLDEAVVCFDEAIACYRALVKNRGRTELANELARSSTNKGSVLLNLGRLGEAVVCLGEAIASFRDLVEPRGRSELTNELAMSIMNLGVACEAGKQLRAAVEHHDEANSIYRHLFQVPRFEILPNLLMANANRWDLAEGQQDWHWASEIIFLCIQACVTKQVATEITPLDHQRFGVILARLRRLTPDQHECLLGAAGVHADTLRQLFEDL